MNNKEEIIKILNNDFNRKLNYQKVRDVKRDYMITSLLMQDNQYDSLTINQFLVVYKIELLNDQGIIDEEMAKSLEELYYYKLYLEDSFEDSFSPLCEMDDFDKKEEHLEQINAYLDGYHLNNDGLDIAHMIQQSIAFERYRNVSSLDDQKKLLKTLEEY